jgi:UDP-2,3-diacylglucosamine pyrophosphatase LpxH
MLVTLISDTHGQHRSVNLPGGDLLIHTGDFMTSGYSKFQAEDFFKWMEYQDYDDIMFIAGNHDRIMQNEPNEMRGILTGYKCIDYLEDEEIVLYGDGPNGDRPEENIRIYGSPWQPEFYDWAFNLPRNGDVLKSKWDAIPTNTDILLTHGPAWGILDEVYNRRGVHLGCELLTERIAVVKPKIHVCGHIHSGHGYYFDGTTHFFNASVLNEQYEYEHNVWHFEWDSITNEINFI